MNNTCNYAAVLLLCFVAHCNSASKGATNEGDQGPLNLSFSKMAVFNEESCLKAGGICVETENCPEDKLSEKKGLCPEQQKRGVECCHGASRSLKDCQSLGGFCAHQCNREITIEQAEDCTGDTVCCALVK